jgi:Na+/H+ antiporter NhaD/arsenite permease-like protein
MRTVDTTIGDTGHLTLVTDIHLATLALIVALALVALRDRRRSDRGLQLRHPDWPTLAILGGVYALVTIGMIGRAAWS